MALGESFSPTNPDQTRQATPAASPLQDAIKILSFRMPSVVGAGAPSPLAGSSMGGPVDDWLVKLFKGILPGGVPAVPTSPGGPAPTPQPSYVPPNPFQDGPMGAPPPPSFTGNAPPPGAPPTGAPPPNVVFTPPEAPKVGLPEPPPPTMDKGPFDLPMAPPPDMPSFGGPSWRDWLGGTGRNQF